jgi:hypothetical protein
VIPSLPNPWSRESCAHWLNWKCGIDLGAAREKVRVAGALEGLPRIAAAMAEGRISYAKVRAMTRVANEANEGNEEYLLNIAFCGTASHVEEVVRGYRRALDAEELSREALQAAEDSLPIPKSVSAETSVDTVSTDDLQRSRKRRVEALATLAESFLATGPKDLSGADRQQIVVHVDAETLKHSHAGRCELEHGPAIAAETARRLACDASVIRILENEKGEPLNVGRKTRTIPPAIRRALRSRDRGCRFPGCSFQRYVDGHHVQHWAKGGETRLSNLVTLCRFHHRLVHEGQVVVQTLDDGAFRFIKPSGETFDSPPPVPADWTTLVAAQEAAAIRVTPATAVTRWTGEALDLDLAVGWLMRNEERRKSVSAETSI